MILLRVMPAHSHKTILTRLDAWYRRQGRALAWRVGPADRDLGRKPDPYHVWLSEVMLQQTTVPHATPYFEAFAKRWPTVSALAQASWEDISAAWAGLGYYSRARSLHACAQLVASRGGFPQAAAELGELPGIGPYTAAAIAAIAFDERIAPVDGNIERVISRMWAIPSDGTQSGWRMAKALISRQAQALADALPPGGRAGDLAQALMDLGAMVCTPRRPACPSCPLAGSCQARARGEAERYPVKPARKALPTRYGSAFILLRGEQVLVVRRPPSGLLGGMVMPPTSQWTELRSGSPLLDAPWKLAWERAGEVRHVFTHFALRLEVWSARAGPRHKAQGEWMAHEEALAAMPTVGRKALALGLRASETKT